MTHRLTKNNILRNVMKRGRTTENAHNQNPNQIISKANANNLRPPSHASRAWTPAASTCDLRIPSPHESWEISLWMRRNDFFGHFQYICGAQRRQCSNSPSHRRRGTKAFDLHHALPGRCCSLSEMVFHDLHGRPKRRRRQPILSTLWRTEPAWTAVRTHSLGDGFFST